jgi:hypothetical protein
MKKEETAAMPQKKDEESRREFLIKAGKIALYIPPAMMVLMHPSRNAFACKSLSLPKCNTGGYNPQGGHHHHHHNGGQN